ncbi:MAG: hypothetical protein M1422_04095 [Candidatus Thermoplasmatota archaeon]|nr:hypothetical protein [Candidatus Sysuiplasma jiujiangense]MBX8640026.1 hypothetical protein [Candidatus Sysuiplasma jiujiangense]MBX8641434.1 hypothetical protein [Candidatus Sysuiplasma jiujiangense]MCL4317435.1 hypothetical protein [Candidatus Thermoplasmatota archaeon]
MNSLLHLLQTNFWFYTPLSWVNVNVTITKILPVRETGHSVSSFSALEAPETLVMASTRH